MLHCWLGLSRSVTTRAISGRSPDAADAPNTRELVYSSPVSADRWRQRRTLPLGGSGGTGVRFVRVDAFGWTVPGRKSSPAYHRVARSLVIGRVRRVAPSGSCRRCAGSGMILWAACRTLSHRRVGANLR